MIKKSIILTGMSGVGKSTIGKKVASETGRFFVDIDKKISEKTHVSLQTIIDTHGDDYFIDLERKTVEELEVKNMVISPGGSLIYNQALMEKLSRIHTIIYLEDTLENITARVRNMDTRGIVGLSKKSFEELYKERCPLYEKHAHLKIFCSGKNVHQISQEILKKIHTNS